ncbi:hypothetical protein [Humisphaera borealis]|uniref:DUF3365 domain-containing protein n=1 Tax=Humisphaera borealis TaxID=2807512 RepID=A0A7M2WVC3_9BACT|nr:hypothetical protein [Humisphaera borealis]QOV89406.1 hypothetical protein IPV69_24930 [Humisphaera borealis]
MKRFCTVLVVGGFSAALAFGQATKPSEPAPKPSKADSVARDRSNVDEPKPAADAVKLVKRRLPNEPVPGSENGKWTTYDAMHKFFVERFVESEGFGFSRMISQRDLARSNALYVDGQSYRVGAVRLISPGEPDKEGKVGKPFAYEPTEKVKMRGRDPMRNALKESDKKALGPFETEAMAKLRAGEQTVMGAEGGKPMLIGAIRATTDCLECHKVKEGTLLGAFRYPLERTEKPAAEAPAEK